ncbi:UDP-N-acetylmuramoylalanyl-D-glutamyl-2,6-diaminopimelate--D-alanyl-D-alanine ligase [Jiella sp. MQZ9-1]|uniref:UDP-N-acetylmuramoyl-tripeptide--D-alanyl-D-alanine ligase n=1 Tax=Jiella flava TaxID=2816857 RepID=A0A939G093_9HYPH|nr:UDP-N-acetylmuramoylalanyl-D-glutamyl-2,6-diaminopimelate--D-alanyl-D-alanine ligase [Jiella flava]MBO0662792.1 UDP-N-acetylmuramoylalanyl-D-glutamyl-2,6-diaminopimelate--D-alanyl-D-alanine ligase [Jiella flava]MCD2471213.1 UDP-N-acetylmuramoylalanyl-D-glutamyl-2,6-diaminopimelate--D-alanyl-D-alanine ligase [Jiella flava]
MSDMLWETSVLSDVMQARPMGPLPRGVSGISIDTRTLEAGDAFFAIKGERFDGHEFLTAAQRAGAALHVVAEHKLPALGRVQVPMLVVDDVMKALTRLAEASRARAKAKIVAVTGSVGKTTTKEALRHGLSAVGSVHASAASFNNHWGVPLSLARLPADADFGIFEIGMNHPDEIRPLVKLVRPHVAIVTLIAPAHLGHFRDIDEIAAAKAEIFEGVVPGGTAILNADDPKSDLLADYARKAGVSKIETFGEAGRADFRLMAFEATREGVSIDAKIEGERLHFSLATPGRHMAQNVLAVLGAAQRIGADVERVATALSSWRAVKGRGARHRLKLATGGTATLIDDSYNANPASMRAALDVLARGEPGQGGRRIAVLGDMLELGTTSPTLHANLKTPILAAGVDVVFLAGDEMKALDDVLAGALTCQWHENNEELLAALSKTMRSGDIILFKASKSIGFSPLVETLLSRYEDKDTEPVKPAEMVAAGQVDAGGEAE